MNTHIKPMTQDEKERAMERDKINSSQDALRRDDLVKRLRDAAVYDAACFTDEAAARIEALEAERDALAEEVERLRSDIKRFELEHQTDHGCIETLMGERDALAEQLVATKEKLEKAVGALGRQAEAWSNGLEMDIIAERHRAAAYLLMHDARATLAQITEQRSCDALRAKGDKTDD